ncbi:methyltransferase [Streptomyces bacillaris]|uniref:methyltransferase n=1 Tax=Streptomyces bacillaris TaxID=68179 RepID=UPI00334B3CB5
MSNGIDANHELRRKIMGFIISQSIFSVNELGIPDLLAGGPASVESLARDSGADADALNRVMRVLAAEGIFAEGPTGVFGLEPMGKLLCTSTAGSLSNFADLMGGQSYQAWSEAIYSVRTGKPAFDHVFGQPHFDWLAENPEAAADFNRAQAGLVSLRMAPLLEHDWSGVGTVVDVGGGNGALLAALLSRHEHLRGVLFDLPHVVGEADPVLREADVLTRCERVGGNFFGALPGGGDVYALAQILHDWGTEDAVSILRNCRAAMPAGGRILILEQVIPEDSQPHPAKLLDLHMLVLLGGRERTESDWHDLLAQSGFRIEKIEMSPRSSLIEARPV